jgi:hypothetical protein
MAQIKTRSDFGPLYFSSECREWRELSLAGRTAINFAESYCYFEHDQDADLFKARWQGNGYAAVVE